MTEQLTERGILYTRFRGYGQDMLVGKYENGRMSISISPDDLLYGVSITGVTTINDPEFRDNPSFFYNSHMSFAEKDWPRVKQNIEDAMEFANELVRRKNELFAMAGFDMTTYKEEDYSEVAREYIEGRREDIFDDFVKYYEEKKKESN